MAMPALRASWRRFEPCATSISTFAVTNVILGMDGESSLGGTAKSEKPALILENREPPGHVTAFPRLGRQQRTMPCRRLNSPPHRPGRRRAHARVCGCPGPDPPDHQRADRVPDPVEQRLAGPEFRGR